MTTCLLVRPEQEQATSFTTVLAFTLVLKPVLDLMYVPSLYHRIEMELFALPSTCYLLPEGGSLGLNVHSALAQTHIAAARNQSH